MKKTAILASVVIASLVIGGCATSRKIQVVQAGDNSLSCGQLKTELEKLDQAEQEVESKKGATGTNVAAALFWLPGLAYTYYDAGQATQAIADRRSHLTTVYNSKNCK